MPQDWASASCCSLCLHESLLNEDRALSQLLQTLSMRAAWVFILDAKKLDSKYKQLP